MSISVNALHAGLLQFVETLPACPHGCPWQDVHGAPTFRPSSAPPGMTIGDQYQAWANQAHQDGPGRLRWHLASMHGGDHPDAATGVAAQPKAGDRVRVTFEGTVNILEPGGITVVMPGIEAAEYFCRIPPGATVEVLPPPTLAERMTALAAEFGHPSGPGDYWAGRRSAAERIQAELAAHAATEAAGKKADERQLCGRSHSGPWALGFCTLPMGHDGFCERAELEGADQ